MPSETELRKPWDIETAGIVMRAVHEASHTCGMTLLCHCMVSVIHRVLSTANFNAECG